LGLAGDDAVDPVALDGARRDAVDADVVRRQLDRHAVGHADLASLGGTVPDAERKAAAAGAGRDVHDRATARLDHLWDDEARAEVGAGETRIDRIAPVLHEVLLHLLRRSAIPRVVD